MVALLLITCFLALAGYLFTSGFHDASNTVAVPVRARALTPKVAVSVSAICNVLGMAICAIFLKQVFAPDWLNVPANDIGLGMLLTALVAQIIWSLITWVLRMPSSSTHALIGGLLGSVWASHAVGFAVQNPFTEPFFHFFILPIVLAPLLILGLSWLAMFPLYKLALRSSPCTVQKVSRTTLSFTNSLISFGHGILSGQRALIMFGLICASAQIEMTAQTSAYALVLSALILASGTLLGGWRIGHTIAHKLARIDPFSGAIAQSITALAIILAPISFNATVSSSQLSATSVLGTGLSQRFSSVCPRVALRLVLTWIATIPAAFVLSAILFLALSPLL